MTLRINIDDDDMSMTHLDGGGVPILYYKGKPFTGVVYETYDNGDVSSEEEYKDSYQEGQKTTYYENGQIDESYNRHHNLVIKGTYKHYDESGNLILSN